MTDGSGGIGNIFPADKLYLAAREKAIYAGTKDPKFLPVFPVELKDIDIEISLLTVPRRVESLRDIKCGRDGIIVRKGMR